LGNQDNQTCRHHHCTHRAEERGGSGLLLALAFNFIIPVAQIAGGIYAHSIALISDAIHNFSDFTAILIAYIAYRISKKGASLHNTFGYRRAEILAAVINVAILIGASGVILYEAVIRLRNPGPVSGYIVIAVAGIGVLGNGLSAWMLHRESKHSLNVRGAFLHLMGDLFTSVAVLVNGIVLLFEPWYWIDPLLSILIVVFILKNCWLILKEAGLILMNATPRGMDILKIRESVGKIPGVFGVHYLHVWQMSSSSIAFSAHIVVHDQLVSQTEILAETIRYHLLQHFKIDHPILQFETSACGNGSLLCEISCKGAQEVSV
jgi:cation diffusion facilitator family transporter